MKPIMAHLYNLLVLILPKGLGTLGHKNKMTVVETSFLKLPLLGKQCFY